MPTVTITGTPVSSGTLLLSNGPAPGVGDEVTAASVQEGVQAAMNIAATVASGSYQTTATVLHSGAETFADMIIPASGLAEVRAGGVAEVKSGGLLQLDVGAATAINAALTLGTDTIGAIAIVSATSATPIVCTLASAPVIPLQDGDIVTIAGGLGLTVMNGDWPIKATSSTVFSLVNAPGSGGPTYTASSATATRRAQVKFSTARAVGGPLRKVWWDETNSSFGTGWTTFVASWVPGSIQFVGTSVPDKSRVVWEIGPEDLPTGGKLLTATVCTQPGTGHVTTPPANPPTVTVYRVDIGLNAAPSPTTLGSVANLVAVPATYELYQVMVVTLSTAEIVDHTRYRYLVVFQSEGSTNAQPGTTVFVASITGTVESQGQR